MPRDDNGGLVGFVGVVGVDGTIYATWNDGNTITFTTSRDGGKTFAASRAVMEVGPPYFGGAGGIPGVARAMGFPQVGVDSAGHLYVCWSDYRNGDVDVFLAGSTDHGKSWGKAVRVNDDALHNGADQFFQWMAVDGRSGAVYVQFYDRRGDPANRKTRVTLARSTDDGRSFSNYDWSDAAFEGPQVFLGDYTWLTAFGDRVYGIWTEAAVLHEEAGQGRAGTVVRVGVADFGGGK
jgi:hypothetical protein